MICFMCCLWQLFDVGEKDDDDDDDDAVINLLAHLSG